MHSVFLFSRNVTLLQFTYHGSLLLTEAEAMIFVHTFDPKSLTCALQPTTIISEEFKERGQLFAENTYHLL